MSLSSVFSTLNSLRVEVTEKLGIFPPGPYFSITLGLRDMKFVQH